MLRGGEADRLGAAVHDRLLAGDVEPIPRLPISFSMPVTDFVTSFCRSGGSLRQKSSFIARPKLETYEYISVEYFRMPPILKAMPAPP